MDTKITNIIKPLFTQQCCRVKVGAFKSLSLGFGKKRYHNNPRLNTAFYGEWEIGTYYCSWRIMKNKEILCGSNDSTEEELDAKVSKIDFGRITELSQLTSVDIRVEFDSGVVVDFLATISDDDEYFHIFCPNGFYVELSTGGKWVVSKTDSPHPY